MDVDPIHNVIQLAFDDFLYWETDGGPGSISQGPKGGINFINMSRHFHPKEERFDRVVIMSYVGIKGERTEEYFVSLFFF